MESINKNAPEAQSTGSGINEECINEEVVSTEQVEISNFPQSEQKQESEQSWSENNKYYEQIGTEQSTGDEGYEGDMEGDGGLMPPPTNVPE